MAKNRFSQIVFDSLGGVADGLSDVADAAQAKGEQIKAAVGKGVEKAQQAASFVATVDSTGDVGRQRREQAAAFVKQTAEKVDSAFTKTDVGASILAGRMEKRAVEAAAQETSTFAADLENYNQQLDASKELAKQMYAASDQESDFVVGDEEEAALWLRQLQIIGAAEDTDEAVRQTGNLMGEAFEVDPSAGVPFSDDVPGGRLLYENTDTMAGFVAKEWELEDGRRYYEGELGRFIYDPTQFEVTSMRNFQTEPGVLPPQTHIPCLHYIGTETDGSKIIVPEGVTSMSGMFAQTNVTSPSRIPEGVKNIDFCWCGCKNLTHANSVVIPSSVESAKGTWAQCESLKKGPAVIPGNVKDIYGICAFCPSLEKPATIRKGVEHCDHAYKGCHALDKEPRLPSSAKSWEDMTDGCSTLAAKRAEKDAAKIEKERERLEKSFDKKSALSKFSAGVAAIIDFRTMQRAGYGFLGSMLLTQQSHKNGSFDGSIMRAVLMGQAVKGRGPAAMMLVRNINARTEEKYQAKEAAKAQALAHFDAATKLEGTYGSKYDVQMYTQGVKDVTGGLLEKIGSAKGSRQNRMVAKYSDTSADITKSMTSLMASKQRSAQKHADRRGESFDPDSVAFSNDEKLKYSRLMRAKLSSFIAYDAAVKTTISAEEGSRGHRWAMATSAGFKAKQQQELSDFFYNVEKQQDKFQLYSKNAMRQMTYMAQQIPGAEDIWAEAKARYQADKEKAETVSPAAEKPQIGMAPSAQSDQPKQPEEPKPVLYTMLGLKSDRICVNYTESDSQRREHMDSVEVVIPLTEKQASGLGFDSTVKSVTILGSPRDIRIRPTGNVSAVLINQETAYNICAVNGDRNFSKSLLGDKTSGLSGNMAVSLLKPDSLIPPRQVVRMRDNPYDLYREAASTDPSPSQADQYAVVTAAEAKVMAQQKRADEFQHWEDAIEAQKAASERAQGSAEGRDKTDRDRSSDADSKRDQTVERTSVENPPAVVGGKPGRIYGESSGNSRFDAAAGKFGDIIDVQSDEQLDIG